MMRMSTTAVSPPIPRAARVEWLTIGVIALVYGVLASLIWFHANMPWWVIFLVGTYAATLHSSLQHEVLHGHPTRMRWLNEALVFVTPLFWLPYARYRDTHLAHHRNEYLTDPELDPESYYLLPQSWAALTGIKRTLYTFNNTLFGRMLIGPAVGIIQFWRSDLADVLRGDRVKLRQWAAFALACTITLSYVVWCGMPVWQYILFVAYPGISLALVRSFCEHQAAEDVDERTIIVEASRFWSLLFLNNNLHAAHHTRPALAWYQLPAYYASERCALLAQNKSYLMKGYGDIFRHYFFRAKEPVAHPGMNWLRRSSVDHH
jgi:fatty acid desaturase